MKTNNLDFVQIALAAFNEEKQKKENKKRQEENRDQDHLFESIQTVLGEAGNEILTGGEMVRDGNELFWRYGEYGFKAVRGSYCSTPDSFQFMVLYKRHDGVFKPGRYGGWSIVNTVLGMGQIISDALEEQAKESIKNAPTEQSESGQVIKEVRKPAAKTFDYIANRFQAGQTSYLDDLLLAVKTYFDSLESRSDDCDDDDDYGDDDE